MGAARSTQSLIGEDGSSQRRLDPVRLLCVVAVLVNVDGDQFPAFIESAACAAASLATGTRYGEQLT